MAGNDNFCSTENYSVLIPYKDLYALMESANKIGEISAQYTEMCVRYDAIQSMFREALDKIAEINRLL